MSGVVVKNLCKQYTTGAEVRHVLRDVSFTVDAGKSLAIVGPSGSGKSTLLNIIGTLDSATSGEVSVFGTAPGSLSDEKRAAATAVYQGTTYYFCAQSCKRAFEQAPEKYIGKK
mgnify:CR=1 FL=1